MNKPELFAAIEQHVLPLLSQYQTHGRANVTANDAMIIKTIWEQNLRGSQLSTNCGSCVLHAMNIIASYHEREKPLYEASIAPVEPEVEQPAHQPEKVTMVIDKKKPCTDCKKKGKPSTTK